MTTRASDGAAWAHELEHTADVGLEVDAPSLAVLFERAALAMLSIMVDVSAAEAREEVSIALEADAVEDLFHDWLQAVLVRFQAEAFVACEVAVDTVTTRRIDARLGGERIDRARHRLHTEVKGVTYHRLAVRETADGWRAAFILDV